MKVPTTCPACGVTNPVEAKFCGAGGAFCLECGAALATPGLDAGTALEVAQEVGGSESIWRAHAALALVRAAQGRMEEARSASAAALVVIDAIATNLKEPGAASVLRSSPDVRLLRGG